MTTHFPALFRWLIVLGGIGLLANPPLVTAQSQEMVWSLEEIVRSKDDPVVLRNASGTVLRRLDATIPRYIYVVAKDIMHAAETTAQFYLTSGRQPNASAGETAGKNTVLINLGMVDMIGADMNQWAALIGHEIAHITLQHQDQRLERLAPELLLQIITYEAIKDPNLQRMANMAFQAYETKFSRAAERESDYLGVIWAVESGYDPSGAVDLHQGLKNRSSGHPVPFLSTHPSSNERIRTLEKLASDLGDK